jgi:hypothetical protein
MYAAPRGDFLTSQVMAARPRRAYSWSMRTTRLLLAVAAFLAFGAYSVQVLVENDGYAGFFALLGREPWALQVTIDLVIASALAMAWLVPDARRLGVPAWPYVAATLVAGSLSGLAYVVHRELVLRRRAARGASGAPAVAAARSA